MTETPVGMVESGMVRERFTLFDLMAVVAACAVGLGLGASIAVPPTLRGVASSMFAVATVPAFLVASRRLGRRRIPRPAEWLAMVPAAGLVAMFGIAPATRSERLFVLMLGAWTLGQISCGLVAGVLLVLWLLDAERRRGTGGVELYGYVLNVAMIGVVVLVDLFLWAMLTTSI